MKTIIFLIVIFSTLVFAIQPHQLSFQGILTDANGVAADDTTHTFGFSIYDAELAGNKLWEETQILITEQGIYQTTLGKDNALNALAFDQTYYVQITVNSTILPLRTQLIPVPYALSANNVTGAVTASATIAAGLTVKSLNTLTDNVTLVANEGLELSIDTETNTINLKSVAPVTGLKGETGAPGGPGEKGEKGEIGQTGATGAAGAVGKGLQIDASCEEPVRLALISSNTLPDWYTCLEESTNKLYIFSASHEWLDIGQLSGDTGDKGDRGAKIINGAFVSSDLEFNLDDNSSFIINGAKESLRGLQGAAGADFTYGDFTADQLIDLTGPQGERGIQGIQGIEGIQGIQGEQGEQGIQGSIGAAFTYGDFTAGQLTGLTGPDGEQGIQGIQGEQGFQGIEGDQGIQGIQGERGPQGIQGAAFTYGDFTAGQLTGLTGPDGEQGIQGIEGEQGIQGIEGDQGIQGIQGERGPQGIQGTAFTYGDFTAGQLTGLTGPDGEQGIQGIQGIQGTQGDKGDTGAQGPAGATQWNSTSSTLSTTKDILLNGTFNPTPGSAPATGAGTRLMWYSDKAAFRAGSVTGTQWDKNNIGAYSAAMGYNTTAQGLQSFAMGYDTKALGDYSIAMGVGSEARGATSTAMGEFTSATGGGSFAIGSGTTASGRFSLAVGDGGEAEGELSIALGHDTWARGPTSIAMGTRTRAFGENSTAMGEAAIASGHASIAMGYETEAVGDASIAMGRRTTALGNFSMAMGENSFAEGDLSIALGQDAHAQGNNSFAIHLANGPQTNVQDNVFWISGARTIGGNEPWSHNSDRRLKKDIQYLNTESNLTTLSKLNGVRYRWKANDTKLNLGFIAQEVVDVVPESVRYDAVNDVYSMEYTAIIPVLVEGMKEQQAMIDAQQKQIDDLKVLVDQLLAK